MPYGTRPTQMRLTQQDKDWLDDIAERQGYSDRTDTVRGLIVMYYEVLATMSPGDEKIASKKSSVAT